MDRIKRLAIDLLKNYKEQFGIDFAQNKKVLGQVSIIRSKSLKNELAGYITKHIKRELDMENEKQELSQTVDAKQSFETVEDAEPISEEISN